MSAEPHGERLRRARATTEARTQLAAALKIFERLGARPWATRAASELRAAGRTDPVPPSETANRSRRKNCARTTAGLTPGMRREPPDSSATGYARSSRAV